MSSCKVVKWPMRNGQMKRYNAQTKMVEFNEEKDRLDKLIRLMSL